MWVLILCMCINLVYKMANKNISITEDAYKFLKMLKGRDKIFSEVILDFKEREKKGTGKNLLKFAGVLKGVDWNEREKNEGFS